MSMIPSSNANTGSFRDFPPGPHSGVDPDPDAQLAPDSIDTRARNALALGLLSLLFGVVTGLPAIWVGWKALRRMDTAGGSPKSRRVAWTGIALGALGVVGTVALWLYLHNRG